MLLRAAIVTLLVLNLGVGAWWLAGGNAARAPSPQPLPADVPRLRLVGEADAPPPATPPAAAPASLSQPAATPPPAATARTEDGRCLRFGPFDDAAARDAARAGIAAAADVVRPRDIAARAARGWKVHIPPFASREEAQAMGERIQAAGIRDWYLLNQGADANGIALGRYGSEAAARRREAELAAKGIPAQAAALGDSAPQWWLDARLKPGMDPASLAGLAASRRIDCAGLR